MGGTNFDILLKFILDQSSQQKTKAGVDALTGDIGDVEKITRAAAKDFEVLEKRIKAASSVPELESLERQLKDVDQQIKETTSSYRLQARVLRAEAAAITDDFAKARIAQIKSISDRIGGISRTGLLAGGAVVGGILAEANRYAKEAENAGKATQATREWTRATEELAAARARVDQVLLKEALPLLQQAAKVATQASQFVERNPEIVQAALSVGLVVASLGAIGIAVSKGIRLYADAQALVLGTQELAAAKLQDLAADKQLVAARLQAGVSGAGVPGAGKGTSGGLAGALTSPLGIATQVLALVAVSIKAADSLKTLNEQIVEIGKRTGVSSGLIGTIIAGLDTVIQVAAPLVPAIKNFRVALERDMPIIQKLLGLGGAAQSAGARAGVAASVSFNPARDQALVEIWSKWQEDDARLVSEAADKRKDIIADAERKIADITRQYNQQRVNINKQFDRSRAQIIEDFSESSQRAEIDYAKARADIIKDSGEDIRKIEEQHQENIRKMTLEHNERVEDLTASRDALGLVKEQRRFDQQRAEAERETNREIAQRRQDTAVRLQELAAEFAAERAQRQADFAERLAENEERRQEELKEAAAAHAEALRQARENRVQQLRELQEGLNAERARRREVFIAQIRDLDASLLGERNLKAKYYTLMLADAERWLAAYRAKLASVKPPDHDFTGYAYSGIYRMAANGQPEYVLSGSATRAAEQVIGGRLTQDAILTALARGAGTGGSRSVTYTDQRRFNASVPLSERRMIVRETVDAIGRELRN